ncbi:MAG: hypothetical protein ND866_18325 [Pyrinomonadaceae bacterium]|nr:hypothetical protein [Pyrinomonadaceae bacterium]
MQEKERQEKYKAQTEELYAAIGRFAVKFEHVCHAMADTIFWCLHFDGLRKEGMANAVLAGLTADPLRKMFGAVLAEARENNEQDKKTIEGVLKRVQKLTESRNNVIHRTWFVGWASSQQEDFSSVSGWKFENTKKGSEFRPLKYSVAEFNELSAEADELTNAIGRIKGCLIQGKRYE